jgi:hypothetical protein
MNVQNDVILNCSIKVNGDKFVYYLFCVVMQCYNGLKLKNDNLYIVCKCWGLKMITYIMCANVGG